MIGRVKVTVQIPDKLVEEWRNLQVIRGLNAAVQTSPLKFKSGFSAARLRNINRSN